MEYLESILGLLKSLQIRALLSDIVLYSVSRERKSCEFLYSTRSSVYLMYSYVSLFTKNTISSAFLNVWSHAATLFIYLFLEVRLLSAVLPIPILWVLMPQANGNIQYVRALLSFSLFTNFEFAFIIWSGASRKISIF
jgi:hypothetical protein